MLHEIIVPELAESTVEATVASWLKKDGEVVSKGDVIIELDTDKVSLEIVSPSNGIIHEVNKSEGEVVRVGDILGIIDDSKSAAPPSQEPKDEDIEKNQKSEVGTQSINNEKPVNITPVAKKIAEKENINLENIKGTGPNGKITKEDLLEIKKDPVKPDQESSNLNDKLPERKDEEIVKLSRRRITIAKRLKEVQTETVMTTTYNEVDLSSVIAIRKKYQDIPLGLSEEEREEFLKSTPERKLDIKDKKIDDILKLKDSQEQSSLPQPVIPAAPFLPDPQIANMFAANINPTTGLTQTESALLSPEEQIIAQRLKT